MAVQKEDLYSKIDLYGESFHEEYERTLYHSELQAKGRIQRLEKLNKHWGNRPISPLSYELKDVGI